MYKKFFKLFINNIMILETNIADISTEHRKLLKRIAELELEKVHLDIVKEQTINSIRNNERILEKLRNKLLILNEITLSQN